MQEAERFKDDERAQVHALASDILRGGGATTLAFVRIIAAFPGLAEGAEVGDKVDESKVSDPDILAQCQEHWPTVANLFYDEEGKSLS